MVLWIPRTAGELEHAVADQAVAESHHLDFKAFTEAGGIPQTAAKCVASLAVDGGVLILGVGEDKAARAFMSQPRPLAGVRDSLDASIAARIAPGLRVTVTNSTPATGPDTSS